MAARSYAVLSRARARRGAIAARDLERDGRANAAAGSMFRTLSAGSVLLYAGILALPNLYIVGHDRDLASWIKLALSLAFLLVLHSSFRRFSTLAAVTAPVALLLGLDLVYLVTYEQPIQAPVFVILSQTTYQESSDYLHGRWHLIIVPTVASIVVWWAGVRSLFRLRVLPAPGWVRGPSATLLACSLVLLGLLMHPHYSGLDRDLAAGPERRILVQGSLPFELDRLRGVYPYGRMVSFVEFLTGERNALELDRRLASFRFGAILDEALLEASDERVTIVLTLGESSRPDRWALGGAQRPTNPRLTELKNLAFFRDFVVAWSATQPSIPTLLSRKPPEDGRRLFPERSVITLFKEAGFHTYWLSNQDRPSGPGSVIGQLSREADESIWVNDTLTDLSGRVSYDGNLLPPLRRILGQVDKKRKLIVVHTLGSHLSYQKRYPPEFNHFRPSLTDHPNASAYSVGNKDLVLNAYDNSILYTDATLADMIATLDGQEGASALYFVSDHGETLFDGECTHCGHGILYKSGFTAASFLWLSQAYADLFPKKATSLHQHATLPVGAVNVFHTLAELGGIRFSGLRTDLSLVSTDFRPQERTVNSGAPVLWERARFVGKCETVMAPE